MPADALPQPWAPVIADTVRFRRAYRDTLGRPMTGTVTLTGRTRTDKAGAVVVPVPVPVEVTGGLLDVALPPDTYKVVAELRTVDKTRVNDTDTITLTA